MTRREEEKERESEEESDLIWVSHLESWETRMGKAGAMPQFRLRLPGTRKPALPVAG